MARTPSGNEPKQARRIYIVELKFDMPDTPLVTTFGSKKAIFEYFGNEKLRVAYNTIASRNMKEGYENSVCSIIEVPLFTLYSPEVAERRAREGREPLPVRHAVDKEIMGKYKTTE